jgi:hypothetical protein
MRIADIPVGFGVIKAGNVAAVRIRTSAIVEGRQVVVVNPLQRLPQ